MYRMMFLVVWLSGRESENSQEKILEGQIHPENWWGRNQNIYKNAVQGVRQKSKGMI
jgi:hypothetical protein